MAVQHGSYLVNADLSKLEGGGLRGWEVEGDFRYDSGRQIGTLKYDVSARLVQEVKLLPGHYLLQVVARTTSNEARLFADGGRHRLDDVPAEERRLGVRASQIGALNFDLERSRQGLELLIHPVQSGKVAPAAVLDEPHR